MQETHICSSCENHFLESELVDSPFSQLEGYCEPCYENQFDTCAECGKDSFAIDFTGDGCVDCTDANKLKVTRLASVIEAAGERYQQTTSNIIAAMRRA